MRIETNTALASRNKKLATYLFILTFAALIGGFFFINMSFFDADIDMSDGLVLALQFLVLPTAFILTLVSVRMTNLWVRLPRPENAIREGLKGLSNKSVLYSYYHFPARHVLICPQGVFAIVTRWHDGQYVVDGDRWLTRKGLISRIFSLLRFDGIGSPTRDAERAAEHLRRLLKPIAPDAEVQPLIVFVDPRASVEVVSSSVPVLHADSKSSYSMKAYLRDLKQDGEQGGKRRTNLPLTAEQIEAFEKATIR